MLAATLTRSMLPAAHARESTTPERSSTLPFQHVPPLYFSERHFRQIILIDSARAVARAYISAGLMWVRGRRRELKRILPLFIAARRKPPGHQCTMKISMLMRLHDALTVSVSREWSIQLVGTKRRLKHVVVNGGYWSSALRRHYSPGDNIYVYRREGITEQNTSSARAFSGARFIEEH